MWMWLIALLAIIPCLSDAKRHFFPKLFREPSFQHLTFAMCFGLFLLWSAEAGVKEGLNIHFLALTSLTLMYGWTIAYLLCFPIVLSLTLFGSLSYELIGQYLVLSCLIPILTSYAVFLTSYRFLPRNIFIYIFIAGFLNGAISGSVQLIATGLFNLIIDLHQWQEIVNNYLIFIVLLAFPEGLLNGMAITLLSVFKPEWLRTFSDRDYIYNHYHKK
ncbi:energy-coupling factor ABC transporter permease [Vibrio sp. 404]|uniref:Energy-coupling factor ABC transporter permease n=2 Tax=Vibrio marinisediminis TaxID=2758441 RepID=A0A7W2FP87_9VIBR|nr:energy-coupling factor ABC transporter permease [Vibrio marinisediminis]MBA5761705.1 energy-coupling factor ABC transporter permease [Vibrio marinisediminis]